jgi:hypothetical protein
MGFATHLVALHLQLVKYSMASEFNACIAHDDLETALQAAGRLSQIPGSNPSYRDYMAIVTLDELARLARHPAITEWLAQVPESTGACIVLVHFAEYDNQDWDSSDLE